MYGIYANIGGILMVNVTIYSSTMDPMGYVNVYTMDIRNQSDHDVRHGVNRSFSGRGTGSKRCFFFFVFSFITTSFEVPKPGEKCPVGPCALRLPTNQLPRKADMNVDDFLE